MRQFRWLSTEEIPFGCDLRRCGWTLAPGDGGTSGSDAGGPALVTIGHYAHMDLAAWARFLLDHDVACRRRVLLLGVEDSAERARLLRIGFGEVLGETVGLGEIEARAAAVSARSEQVVRRKVIGTLALDLVDREAYAGVRPLGLHPREFALVWRLAEQPGVPVGKARLLRDVWRLTHVPETNSLAVHVSRLRDKLRVVDLSWMVATTPDGGYVLLAERPQASGETLSDQGDGSLTASKPVREARSAQANAIWDTVDEA